MQREHLLLRMIAYDQLGAECTNERFCTLYVYTLVAATATIAVQHSSSPNNST
jgi:hypothetical protein